MITYNYVQGDTAPNPIWNLRRDNDTIVDLTGATVRFKIKNRSTGEITNEGHQECDINDLPTAEVEYDIQDGDLPSKGTYLCDLEVTYSDLKVETYPDYIKIRCRAEIA